MKGQLAALEQYKQELDEYGYVIVENLIPDEVVEPMASRLFEIMRHEPSKDALFQNRQALLNYDLDCFLPLVTSPVHHELARHKLGEDFRFGETGTVLNNPGAPGGALHADVPLGWFPEPLPNTCFVLNSIYMLTDFTRDNGATLLLPFSHHSRRRPRRGVEYRGLVAAEAPRGSAVIFDGGIWHATGKNITSDQPRLGVSVVYHHRCLDATQCGWNNFDRSAYDRLPPDLQPRFAHKLKD